MKNPRVQNLRDNRREEYEDSEKSTHARLILQRHADLVNFSTHAVRIFQEKVIGGNGGTTLNDTAHLFRAAKRGAECVSYWNIYIASSR